MKRALFIASIATLVATLAACMHDAQPDQTTPDPAPAGDGSAEAAASPADATPTPTPTPAAADPTGSAPLARPASVTDRQVALGDEVVAAFEDLGVSLSTIGTDCTAAAAAISAIGVRLAPIAAETEKMKDEFDSVAQRWFQQTYNPRMIAALGGMIKVSEACQADAGFAAAMASLPLGRKKTAPPTAP